jgi:hypothetical protein
MSQIIKTLSDESLDDWGFDCCWWTRRSKSLCSSSKNVLQLNYPGRQPFCKVNTMITCYELIGNISRRDSDNVYN